MERWERRGSESRRAGEFQHNWIGSYMIHPLDTYNSTI
jgi:hypothetical protein